MRLSLTDAADYKSVNQELATVMIDYFIEQGFTFFGTEYVYHFELSEYS
jgi:predicted aldo/keto reductase-like oxidoreductase